MLDSEVARNCVNIGGITILVIRTTVNLKVGVSVHPEVFNERVYNFTIFHRHIFTSSRTMSKLGGATPEVTPFGVSPF
jgi:hypothetical protein